MASPILIFDSGLGGLTVYRALAAALPDADYVYAADDAGFPYGALRESTLRKRVVAVIGDLIGQYDPALVVVACNTASTVVLPDLRAEFSLPFVGTVPAIKPACMASVSKLVSVLGTRATVQREYTRALIRDFGGGCDVTLVGAERLAAFAESEWHGNPASDADLSAEIAPCFVEKDSGRTDIVVLACTHYPLLLARLRTLSPWPVTFIDPAPAIARRVAEIAGCAPSAGTRQVHFTSGAVPTAPLAAALAAEGFGSPLPV